MDLLHLTPVELEALELSLWVSGWAVAVSLPAGILTAWVLARRRFPGRNLLDGLVHLPLVLPPVVIGYLLLVMLGRNGIIGGPLDRYLGVVLAFNWKGAALAAAVMAFPLLVRAVRLSLEGVDPGLEAAARTLGAGPVRVFFTVTLPLMVPGIITGGILAFARSLGEFGATITFVSNIRGQTQTLPLALYTLTQVPDGETGAMRLCLLSVLIAMAALVFSEISARKFAARMAG
ncbi:molybdate ABC transporter permease [Desulfococcus multivorans]|uniref:Molybdenum transport system permease n=1 Tax=Desulfococcus multivorans DSM 2059 TaxID=1121405 RepID=S7TSC8_DESML|nr:ModB1: molybdate ABC transporter, permease protein [Desulfococcus multivorans]AQU99652.1 molybdate ABC transporter permease [Desulfococcus multivorans]EPR39916.1 molybdate ABC transporter, inner membrane subunit [Desulfococcus multivorans DSM 2059]SKA23048.1 molybdate transport system permease protein [Desulfococcus multivorans DSM 2059]